jgi:hypothetical protein
MAEFKEGDAVWFHYSGETRVGHVLDAVEARALNDGTFQGLGLRENMSDIYKGVTQVERATRRLHYYPDCVPDQAQMNRHPLSWEITHTTCRRCLRRRARDLRGWRWTIDFNREHVEYLRSVLGPEIDKMADIPALDEHTPHVRRMRQTYSWSKNADD